MNLYPEPNELRDQYHALTLMINVRSHMDCHLCGSGGPAFGHLVGGVIQPICETCKSDLYPVLSEMSNVKLTLLEIAALFDTIFPRRPRTIYLVLCEANRQGKIQTTREMGPLGRLSAHISVREAYKFLSMRWTPNIVFSEECCE